MADKRKPLTDRKVHHFTDRQIEIAVKAMAVREGVTHAPAGKSKYS